ncbi:MAG: Double zinc ribbon [Actinobacteria bacterium ADurb.Bin346]|nr:MAG: Double zinc ribbon [Actinobacteria bacterium ADurb.Bin346]
MVLNAFTDNYEDNSTEAGFQFTFFCDLCNEGYKTQFVSSKTYGKGKLLGGLGKAISIGASFFGQSNIGSNIEEGSDILSERFEGMSPEWMKEHDAAFVAAQTEAKGHFHRCPKCKLWVCDNDWNEQDGLCVDDAPRENVEVAAARGKKMVEDIEAKASQTQVFTGDIERKQTLCPECGKPAGQGKFCNNCGASLEMNKCSRCGAKNSANAKFCGECGNKLI